MSQVIICSRCQLSTEPADMRGAFCAACYREVRSGLGVGSPDPVWDADQLAESLSDGARFMSNMDKGRDVVGALSRIVAQQAENDIAAAMHPRVGQVFQSTGNWGTTVEPVGAAAILESVKRLSETIKPITRIKIFATPNGVLAMQDGIPTSRHKIVCMFDAPVYQGRNFDECRSAALLARIDGDTAFVVTRTKVWTAEELIKAQKNAGQTISDAMDFLLRETAIDEGAGEAQATA